MATVRLPIFGAYTTRLGNTNKDQRFKNCFLELIRAPRLDTQAGNQAEGAGSHIFRAVKRPGYSVKHNTTHTAAGRGLYAWKGNLYSVIGDRVYKGTTEVTGGGNRLSTTTGRAFFTEQHKTDLLVIKAGDQICTVTTGDTFTILTDPQIPTSLVAGIIYLDYYILVMNGDGEIYNSDVDDVANWTAGSFVTAKIEPDDGVALVKWQNYAVAMGAWSTEMFFDDANASGSPLDPAEGVLLDVGCAAGNTAWADEDLIIWLCQSKSGGKRVVAFAGNGVKDLSNPAIDRIIDQEGTNIDQAYGYGMRLAGHLFYVLTLTTQAVTLVCDVHLGTWYEWTSDPGTETYFTGIDHAEDDGIHYLLDEDNGRVYEMDFDKYQDVGSSTDDINFEIRTAPQDFGTSKQKFCHRLTLLGDEQTSASAVTLDWSDNDYQAYSSTRSLDMSTNHPAAYNLGSFKRRAFRLQHVANTPLSIDGIELEVSLGAHTGGGT